MAKRRTCECKKLGCYTLTENKTGYCNEHEREYLDKVNQRKKEWKEKVGYKYNKHYATNRTEQFYSSKQWQEMRSYILARDNYLCQDCLKEHKITAARDVHHIEFLLNNWDKRLDDNNLIALCRECHRKRHGKA